MSRRVGTRVLEDAGDVIRDVNLVDVSATETLAGAQHDPAGIVTWRPAGSTEELFSFRIKSTSSGPGGHLITHQLETTLGRLTRVYPSSVLATAELITRVVTGTPAPAATITQTLEYTLRRWQTEFPWLEWEPIPALTVQTSAGPITPTVQALALRRDPSRPTSARAWIDEMLALFTGYVLRVTAEGKLQVVPPPTGPPSITLPGTKIIGTPERSTTLDDVVNRATVTSRLWAFEAQQLTEPFTISFTADDPDAIAAVTGSGPGRTGYRHLGTFVETDADPGVIPLPLQPDILTGLTGFAFADIQVERWMRAWDDTPGVEGWETTWEVIQDGAFQEITLSASAAPGDVSLRVAPLEQQLLAGASIVFSNGVTAVVSSAGASRNATAVPLASLSGAVPNGMTALHSRVIVHTDPPGSRLLGVFGPPGPRIEVWAGFRNGFEWFVNPSTAWPPTLSSTTGLPVEHWWASYRIVCTLYAYDYRQTRNTVSATFGRADDPDQVADLPEFVGSQAEFGIVERNLNAGFVNLDVLDALAIAEGYVRANMRPRERLTLEITPDLPIVPADLNKLVHLTPLGSDVVIESWERTEVFDNTSANVTTRVTSVVRTPGEPINPGDRHFSHAFDRSFAGGLNSPQDNT